MRTEVKNAPVDICILTAGRYDLLNDCLDSVANLEGVENCNVYVWDNNPDTESRLAFSELFRHPVITKERYWKQNSGFTGGANSVIAMGKAPLVLFITDDVALEPNVLSVLKNTMDCNSNIGLCGLKLLFASGEHRGKVQHVGHSMTIRGKVIHPFLGWSADNPKTCISGERYSVTGATFMVRRKVFKQVDGFSTVYGKGYYEDVELALNIKSAGYIIYCECGAIGHHHVGASFTTFKEKYNQESPLQINEQLFMTRNRARMVWTDWLMR